ncbi:MAG: ribbon-helix-helix domain-containing protein [Devosiaceae bacterium]|nr:ribbon-helix-helix domain-containing protein [Devosiaceae bacterium MH13]
MLIKRSISLSGHRTSIALEAPFWDELTRIATSKGLSRAALISDVDKARPPGSNLASTLRVLVLENLRETVSSAQD